MQKIVNKVKGEAFVIGDFATIDNNNYADNCVVNKCSSKRIINKSYRCDTQENRKHTMVVRNIDQLHRRRLSSFDRHFYNIFMEIEIR